MSTAFGYQPIVGGETFDVAERFAQTADARIAITRDAFAWAEAVETIWSEAVDLGWPLMMVPENAGGVGGTLWDVAALVEGASRFALAAPLAKSLVLLPRLLDRVTLARFASDVGRPGLILDAAYPWMQRSDTANLTLQGNKLCGHVLGTELTPGATHLIVAVEGALVIVAAATVDTAIHRRIDGRLAGDLRFTEVTIEQQLPGDSIANAIDLGALVACIEIVAGAATVIEDSIRYLNERQQFGVALSSFQVLRHYVADMYIAYQNAHALTAATLRAVIANPDALPWRAIAMAKLRVGEVARFVAETAIQVHGGMGMTEENRATRIGKRLMLADLEWGDRTWQLERLMNDRTERVA